MRKKKDIAPENNDSLIPFTGYYSLTGPLGVANGAFLSIDTVWIHDKYSQSPNCALLSVSISLNGTNSHTFLLDQNTSFDGKTLNVPYVLKINLERKYQDGILTSFSGSVKGYKVSGFNRFNQIPLSTFNGDYKSLKGTTLLMINDSEISFDFGLGLQKLIYFTFTPLMFLLTFYNPFSGERYIVMLGTSVQMGLAGLACYIEHGATGEYAMTIPIWGNQAKKF